MKSVATVLITAAALVIACSSSPSREGDGVSYDDWAAEVCQIAERAEREGTENAKLINEDLPRAVTLDEKRSVFLAWTDLVADTFERMATDLGTVPRPLGTTAYHRLLVETSRSGVTQIARARIRIEQATTESGLSDALTALVDFATEGDQSAADVAAQMPAEAISAMNRHAQECGSISWPN
jgi:hypothetical protein